MLSELILNLPLIYQKLFYDTLFFFIVIFPFIVPCVLAYLGWLMWIRSNRYAFRLKQDRILLEIKPPAEIKKSPAAMEIFLDVLHQTGGESTWYDRSFLGKSRTWFSLELVSLEGNVKFFIWTERRFKNLIEAQLYAQYPQVEIYEANDYTKFVELDLNKKGMWGNEFILTKADPYPIKTYRDYGLDKVGLENDEIVEPMSAVLEYLGSIGKGEQLWIQIMVRAHKKEIKKKLSFFDQIKKGKLYDKHDWTKIGTEEKEALLESMKRKVGDKEIMRIPTKTESEVIEALERNLAKPAFDCGIRGIYISDMDKFNAINITGLMGSFKQYNSISLNGFKVNNTTSFDYPWQDFRNYRLNKKKHEIFGDYKRRAYFYYPNKADKQFVLSSEELATIFHLPSRAVMTPTFIRVDSKKSEPPTNLPV